MGISENPDLLTTPLSLPQGLEMFGWGLAEMPINQTGSWPNEQPPVYKCRGAPKNHPLYRSNLAY